MTGASRRLAAESARHRVADRGWLGVALALAGAVMLFLGWYGVSGAATVGEQLPFVASGSIPGAALVVAAAVVLSRESAQRAGRRTEALVAELHALLVEEVPPEQTAVAAAVGPVLDDRVALPGSERYHRADCLLVAGKANAEPVDSTAVAERHLSACDVCEPDRPAV